MSFLNTALLAGLAATAIPIIIHLLNRRSAKVVEWGAMRFLLDSMLTRKKRIQLEEALLLAARCLLVALLALCVARPLADPASQVPWVAVLPLFLLAVAMAAVTTVMWQEKRLRWRLLGLTLLLLGLCGAAILVERWLNLQRFGTAGRKDIALVIDGSMSMTLANGGGTTFDAAVKEAEKIITEAGGGTAFSIILGAPVPQAVVAQPLVNRAELKSLLGGLRPVNGPMAAFDALALATFSLAQGRNPQKEIIVLTDGQDTGWELDHPARWEALKAGFANLQGQPRLILRQFPLPPSLRNLGLGAVRFSRQVIGTDRPVTIEIPVTNTGTESVTPASVELTIGGTKLTDSSLGQLLPGATESIRFTYKFQKGGSYVVSAKVNVEDDLPGDDTWVSVAEVQPRLRVLIVDGNPAGPFLERAGSFAALALAPGSLLKALVSTDSPATAADADLIDPEVKSMTQLAASEGFSDFEAVILCDVPALPASQARQLAAFVEAGGGLLIAPGAHATPAFYNDWRAANGQTVLPLRLLQQTVIPKGGEETKVSLTTFSHAALRLVADAKQSDLGSLVFTRYWKLADPATPEAGVTLGGRFTTGDPFFAARRLGQGSVLQLAASLDPVGSNLPSRQAFVALMHEMIYHLANPGGQRLNREPAYVVNVPLTRTKASNGLRGEYFDAARGDQPVVTRIDPRIKFEWGKGAPAPGLPADNFRVHWTGSLVPKFSESYSFPTEADDSLELAIGDTMLVGQRRKQDRIELVAGQPVPIRIEFAEGSGTAGAKVYWESQSQRRELIPADAFLPHAPGEPDEFETSGGTFDAIGPDQLPRSVEIVYTRAGTFARLKNTVVPGLYQVPLPEARRAEFANLVTSDGQLAFAITPQAGEGKINPLPDEAFQFFQRYVPTLRPGSADDVLAILAGRQFGEELWKYLAGGALFLLLAEIALTRWIAVQRQSGAEATIDFAGRFQPNKAFQDQVDRLQDVN